MTLKYIGDNAPENLRLSVSGRLQADSRQKKNIKVTLTIDGKEVEDPWGTTIITIYRKSSFCVSCKLPMEQLNADKGIRVTCDKDDLITLLKHNIEIRADD